MNKTALYEYINPSSAAVTLESDESHGGKNLYMKGVFIEGGVRNANQRIYPVNEIASAVKTLQNQINEHLARSISRMKHYTQQDDLYLKPKMFDRWKEYVKTQINST